MKTTTTENSDTMEERKPIWFLNGIIDVNDIIGFGISYNNRSSDRLKTYILGDRLEETITILSKRACFELVN